MIDHVETAVATDATQVVVPFAFDPRALNRAMLIFASYCHPTNGLAGLTTDATYAGTPWTHRNTDRSVNSPPARQAQFLVRPAALSGDVVVTFSVAMHAVVHAVGLRGVDAPGFLDRASGGGGQDNGATISLFDLLHLGLAGVSNTSCISQDPATVTSVTPTGSAVLSSLQAGSGLGSVRGTLVSIPTTPGTQQIVALFSGLNDWAMVGMSMLGGLEELSVSTAVDLGGRLVATVKRGLATGRLMGALAGRSGAPIEARATVAERLAQGSQGSLEGATALRARLAVQRAAGLSERPVGLRGVLLEDAAAGRAVGGTVQLAGRLVAGASGQIQPEG